MSTRTRFEKETKANSEMAFCLRFPTLDINFCKLENCVDLSEGGTCERMRKVLKILKSWAEDIVPVLGISKSTGMDPHDIAATLQILNMVQKRDGK